MTSATCENCMTSEGRPYAFHYGRVAPDNAEIVYHASAYPGTTSRSHDGYQIGGVEAVVVCNRCLKRARARRAVRVLWDWMREPLVILGYLAWVVALVVWTWQGDWSQLLVGAGVGVVITAGVYAAAYVVLRDEDFAQHLAVDLHQEKLREQGWDSFWTDNEFAHLAPH